MVNPNPMIPRGAVQPDTSVPIPAPNWPPYAYEVLRLDLSAARVNEVHEYTGNGIFAVDASSVSVVVNVGFNDPSGTPIPMRVGANFQGMGFDKIYLSNPVGNAGDYITLVLYKCAARIDIGAAVPQYVNVNGLTGSPTGPARARWSAGDNQYSTPLNVGNPAAQLIVPAGKKLYGFDFWARIAAECTFDDPPSGYFYLGTGNGAAPDTWYPFASAQMVQFAGGGGEGLLTGNLAVGAGSTGVIIAAASNGAKRLSLCTEPGSAGTVFVRSGAAGSDGPAIPSAGTPPLVFDNVAGVGGGGLYAHNVDSGGHTVHWAIEFAQPQQDVFSDLAGAVLVDNSGGATDLNVWITTDNVANVGLMAIGQIDIWLNYLLL